MVSSSLKSPCCGESERQSSLVNVVRNDPENSLPPDFVIALTTPPEKRPNSAEIDPVVTVVSWIASSMKSGSAWPRRFSFTETPLIRNRFSNDIAPDMTIVCVAESLLLPPGPVADTFGASSIVAFSERSLGSWLTSSARTVVATGAVAAKFSVRALTVTLSETVATSSLTSSGTVCAAATFTFCSNVRKPESSARTVYSPGGRNGRMKSPFDDVVTSRTPWRVGDVAVTVTPGRTASSCCMTRPEIVPVGLPCAAALVADAVAVSSRQMNAARPR